MQKQFGSFFLFGYRLNDAASCASILWSSILCNPSNQSYCNDQRSVSNSGTEVTDKLQPDNTETPIIIPDISPTDEDLGDTATSNDLDGTDTEITRDNGNTDDDSEDNIDRNSEGNEDPNRDDESDHQNKDDDDPKSSLIPFPQLRQKLCLTNYET